MSATTDPHVRCSRCGTDFQAELYSNLHVTRSPHVRDAILAGRFQCFTCPGCGEQVRVEPTLLYTDFERYQWFATFPTQAVAHRSQLVEMVLDGFHTNMTVACPPVVAEWAPHFAVRVVFGLASLRDKLLSAQISLDDRVLEVFKLWLLRDQVQGALHPDGSLYLSAVDGTRLIFSAASPTGPDGTQVHRQIAVQRSQVAPMEADATQLALRYPLLFDGPVVDWRAHLHPDGLMPLPPEPAPRLPWMAEHNP